jgi:hypothetical protein
VLVALDAVVDGGAALAGSVSVFFTSCEDGCSPKAGVGIDVDDERAADEDARVRGVSSARA